MKQMIANHYYNSRSGLKVEAISLLINNKSNCRGIDNGHPVLFTNESFKFNLD